MKIELDLAENLLVQFAAVFGIGVDPQTRHIEMPPHIGEGPMDLVVLPDGIEFYHYHSVPRDPMTLRSSIPADGEWFGFIINLGRHALVRQADGKEMVVQRNRPAGIMILTPGSAIEGTNPPDERRESACLRVPSRVLSAYRAPLPGALVDPPAGVLVESFDLVCERALQRAIESKDDMLGVHASVLALLHRIVERVEKRKSVAGVEPIDTDARTRLFASAARLRDPSTMDNPTIDELAAVAGMSPTRFKTAFRAVFGEPPQRYRRQARLGWAFDELAGGRRKPSEVSYMLGYSHPSKFTVAFRKHFGEVPSAIFRRRSSRDKDTSGRDNRSP